MRYKIKRTILSLMVSMIFILGIPIQAFGMNDNVDSGFVIDNASGFEPDQTISMVIL